jgi:hypothetical protein
MGYSNMFGNRGHSSRGNRKPRALDLTLIVRPIEGKSNIKKCLNSTNPWFWFHLNDPHAEFVTAQVDGLVRQLDSFWFDLSRSNRKLFKGQKHCLLKSRNRVFGLVLANNISEHFLEFAIFRKTLNEVKKC